jgi:hypothetical protein
MSDIQNAPGSKGTLLNRVLLGVVILLGVLIVAAFLALVYGAVTLYGKRAKPQPAQAAVSLEKLPPGAKILDMKVDNDGHTVVRLQTPQGQEIDTYDTASGKRISRIAPQP